MGTPDFSVPALKVCFEESELVAVVSQPDRPRGRGQQLSPSPVKAWALEKNIPVFTPLSLRKESSELSQWNAFIEKNPFDVLVVVAYGNLLPQSVLDLPKLLPINIHTSLLPRLRGAAPIQRALEAGDSETGVCIQKMVLELDAGNVLLDSHFQIPPHFGAVLLTDSLSQQAGALLKKFFDNLRAGNQSLTGTPQNPTFVTYAKKIEKSEGAFSSAWKAQETLNKIRAFEFWPKVEASFDWNNSRTTIKILSALEVSSHGIHIPKAGTIFLYSCHVLLSCSDGLLELTKVQLPGKPPQEAYAALQNFLNKSEKNELLLY